MDVVFECPHCLTFFIMNKKEFNCKIIRHAVLKSSLVQINPHASKQECDALVASQSIIGCGNPLKIIDKGQNEFIVVACEFI